MIDVLGGTPEARWRADRNLDRLPTMYWGEPGPVVVVSPHPDDEVLGIGGTLRVLADRGFDIELVAVTDGESSHPGSTAIEPAELRRRRPLETRTALSRLGVHLRAEHRLQIPDGGIADRVDDLAEALAKIAEKAAWLLTIWRDDGHPDHEAVGAAAALTGVRLAEYPVWMWNWAGPGDERVPWSRARRNDIDSVTKSTAIDAFTTQLTRYDVEPVLPRPVLEYFQRPFEVVFV